MDASLIHQRGREFRELADALRRCAESILHRWEELARQQVSSVARRLSPTELRGPLPEILARVADAVERPGPEQARRLEQTAPAQGIRRFHQHFNLREALTEDRLFRRAVLEQVEAGLGRPISTAENVRLNVAIDVAMQEGILTLFERQQERLRRAAESQLGYLSFLSHDLGNSLHGISLRLQLLKSSLKTLPEPERDATVDDVQQAVAAAMEEMRQLLEHERLRLTGAEVETGPVYLRELALAITQDASAEVARKGLRLVVDVPPEAVVHSHPHLIATVLRNLIGNAVKYSEGGTVTVAAAHRRQRGGREGSWVLSVSDQGPGIAPDLRERIFKPFQRGETHGQQGVGLGLAIVWEAAKLLRAELTRDSRAGEGSTFSVSLPAEAPPHLDHA